ncbi:MAG: AAA family ATPase [Bacteroidales bacterium]|nr:AAA family ATPase [Bacteroidales bacterium]
MNNDVTITTVPVQTPVQVKKITTDVVRVYKGIEWLHAAGSMDNPEELWMKTWYEGEVCCLFADSNLGKSIYATQIGLEIARKGRKVLYFDFELSEKQFQLRYTDEEGNYLQMPDTFYRADINPEMTLRKGETLEAAILRAIEISAVTCETDVIIVDNISYLNMVTESGDAAAELMVSLMQLKKVYGWSILILAHTPKRLPDAELSCNDLAGSKKLFNFFDCVLAMGKSLCDSRIRYVKQLKVRHGSFTYDDSNVVLYEIEKQGAYLLMAERGYARESSLLQRPKHTENHDLLEKVRHMKENGKSVRAMATELGLSKTTITRMIKKIEK